MDENSTAGDLFQAGCLQQAIDAAIAEVKSNPTNTDRRGLLAELLCFSGEWERADKQIDTIGHQDPQAIVGLSLIRQLIRAEVTRRECFLEGRPPELLAEPSPMLEKTLEALVALREQDQATAGGLLTEAEKLRPRSPGKSGDDKFDDLRDLDDLTAGFFEVLTSTGRYFWVPISSVQSMDFHPPSRPRDLLWRQVSMSVEEGPDGDVYLPTTYFAREPLEDEQLTLGRGTQWVGNEGEPTQGRGQRMFLVGEEAVPIMQLSNIEFDCG